MTTQAPLVTIALRVKPLNVQTPLSIHPNIRM